jgi:pyruvate,orthophosphate dikinase
MIAAQGILTSRGGKTSHAAVVARGMGKTCVCGAEELEVDLQARTITTPTARSSRGRRAVDRRHSGEVFLGEVAVTPSPGRALLRGRAARARTATTWCRRCTGW